MQTPFSDIKHVVSLLTTAETPEQQRDAVNTYFAEDVEFRHPLVKISSNHLSREDLLAIYQSYRILSPHIEIDITNVVYDNRTNTLYLDITQLFHIRFSPFKPVPAHFVTRLKLIKKNKKFLIASQEDFYQPDEFIALILPPLMPLMRYALTAGGYITAFSAKMAQVMGYWRPTAEPSKEKQASEDSQDSEDTHIGSDDGHQTKRLEK
ncbi:hypothetical protein Hypma_010937 [Hypsizygus marmoreus]|uniref:SigF-like NTF2-like domain-containing protein n=1 Tax=Hypsizygus marmoreus TaxID=39966 RepID=A0A369JIL4_HYPMA|nr:hypothetical protein Hypma_010937 [Hypsizygus marmoreus]